MENQFNFALAAPEIILVIMAMGILVYDAFSHEATRKTTYVFSLCALIILTVVSLMQWNGGIAGTTFYGMYVADPLAHFLKIASYLAVLVTLIYSRQYVVDRDMSKSGELYPLTLCALLGQMVMISASSMLTIYLGLELMSLALYTMVALRRDSLVATESAMKYFVLGALASGFMLYGISMVYGATGHVDLAGVTQVIRSGQAGEMTLVLGTVFIVAGLAFKLGAVPFHMWIPDVYQGAPTAITLTIGAAPKLAALAITLRLLIEGLNGVALSWQPMLIILAVLSLAIGNLTAIMQTNFKRMLAYSTISHVGFILLGLLSGVAANGTVQSGAYASSLFYIVTYVLTTLASFGLVLLMSRQGFECEEIDDLKGLNQRNPVMAFGMLLLMFSLAGIPPLVGFHAKLVVLQAVISAGHVWLAIYAVICSLIGAFYYLRVVKVVYFDDPAQGVPGPDTSWSFRSGVMSVNGALIILLGILPGGLMALCVQVIDASLKF